VGAGFVFDLADMDRLRYDPTAPPPVPGPIPLPPLAAAVGTRQAAAATAADPARAVLPPPPPVVAPPPAPDPLLGGPRVSQVEGSQTTTTRHKMDPREKIAVGEMEALADEEAEAAKRVGAARVGAAEDESVAADQAATDASAHSLEQRQLIEQGNRDYEAAEARYRQKSEAYDKLKFHDYFSSERGGNKVLAAIAVGLGQYGAAMAGTRNAAKDIIDAKIDQDFKIQRAAMEKEFQGLERSREDIQLVRQRRADMQNDLGLKYVATKEAAATQRVAMLAQRGVPLAQAQADATVIGLRADAAKVRQGIYSGLRSTIASTVMSRMTEGAGAGGKGGSPTGTDVEHVNRLSTDIGNMDRVIGTIKENPKAWVEYQKNAESWKRKQAASEGSTTFKGARALFQGAGVADVSEEQGLKSEAAKDVHKGVQAALTSIAKGYGGVITQSDRDAAAAALANLANDPRGAIRTLQQIRNNLAASRDNFVRNRGGSYSTPAEAGPGAPAAAPRQVLSNQERARLVQYVQTADPNDPRRARALQALGQ
jgi:hypothetical protein